MQQNVGWLGQKTLEATFCACHLTPLNPGLQASQEKALAELDLRSQSKTGWKGQDAAFYVKVEHDWVHVERPAAG